VLDEGEYVNFEVSLYKKIGEQKLEAKETNQKSEVEKIQRLFSKYFGTYGGRGFVIIHKGKRYNFDSTRVYLFFFFFSFFFFLTKFFFFFFLSKRIFFFLYPKNKNSLLIKTC
jgi:hypothetical protein